MNITQPLISPPDQSRNDYLKVLAQYAGEGVCTLYIDGVDIVHADTIPELQTSYIAPALPSGNFSDLLKKLYSLHQRSHRNAFCFYQWKRQ